MKTRLRVYVSGGCTDITVDDWRIDESGVLYTKESETGESVYRSPHYWQAVERLGVVTEPTQGPPL